MRRILTVTLFLALAASARAEDLVGGRIHNLKVLSSRVDDVTTVDNVLRSFVRPGMTDRERSRALWTAATKYRHQAAPPNEYLAADWEAHDPIKLLNVYGYCMCCCSSALLEALNRADGRDARGRILNGHSVAEVRDADGWHMYDASLTTYFPKPDGGADAAVEEISRAVADWYAAHPEYRKNGSKLADLMRRDNWTGWKANGPALLAACPWLRAGYYPARTHGWNDTMVEYDLKSDTYEYGYHVGHRALFSLRPGESLVREAGHRGLHVNMETAPDWDGLKARAPEADLAYIDQFLPGYRGGLVGNGIHRYAPDLAAGDLRLGAETYENLAVGGSPALHLKAGDKPGVAVIPLASPYVYLGGRLKLRAVCRGPGDRVRASISTDNGRSYRPVIEVGPKSAAAESVADLRPFLMRRYAFWLKVEIDSATPEGAGLDALEVEADIQHAPRTLPWLGRGKNTITVAADADPALATRTIAGRITADPKFDKNETVQGLGVTADNLNLEYEAYWWKGGTGTLNVPIDVPGPLAALRFSVQARVRSPRDRVKALVSTDDGKSWRDVGTVAGPSQGTTRTFRVADLPADTRKALLRFELTGENTSGILSFRVDADYRDPLASPAVHPFRVVHRWTEDGRPKSHTETVRALPATYNIDTAADPTMVSVTYEMPAGAMGQR